MKQAIKDITDKLRDGETTFTATEVATLLNEINILKAVSRVQKRKQVSATIQSNLLNKHLNKGVK